MLRNIDGIYYNCIDVGCSDFLEAKQNRERIKNKEYTEFWRNLEAYLSEHPSIEPLPDWIPTNKQ
jgi:hypothetical protein